MGAEAVIFFDPKRGAGMQSRRKRGGGLASKHRFIAAQIEAFLKSRELLELTPMIVTEPNGTQWCNWCDRRGRVKISYKIENG